MKTIHNIWKFNHVNYIAYNSIQNVTILLKLHRIIDQMKIFSNSFVVDGIHFAIADDVYAE